MSPLLKHTGWAQTGDPVVGRRLSRDPVERRCVCRDVRSAQLRRSEVEPFSEVQIHMEMDMEWKWMEMRHNL